MARRRRSRSKGYSRRNQLDTDTELIIGGVVGVVVLGTIGYLIYRSNQPATVAAPATSASLFGTANPLPASAIPASGYASSTDYFGTINPSLSGG
jgi:hypothetical protein